MNKSSLPLLGKFDAPICMQSRVRSILERSSTYWIEPIVDAQVLPTEAGPAERAMLRQSIRLAFIAALQKLQPRQRASLLPTEVLGCSVAEVAEMLDTSVAAVNSALHAPRLVRATKKNRLNFPNHNSAC